MTEQLENQKEDISIFKKPIFWLIGLIAFLCLILLLFPVLNSARIHSMEALCLTKMKKIGKALKQYSYENDSTYPDPNKWCDLLIQNSNGILEPEDFACPYAKNKSKCNYALNPYCTPDSNGDVVLLFETNAGWNQFGGPELLNSTHHTFCPSCFRILYNYGYAYWETIEDPNQLRWKD